VPVEVDEVDHVAVAHPVDEVAERARDHHGHARGEPRSAPALRKHDGEHDDGRERREAEDPGAEAVRSVMQQAERRAAVLGVLELEHVVDEGDRIAPHALVVGPAVGARLAHRGPVASARLRESALGPGLGAQVQGRQRDHGQRAQQQRTARARDEDVRPRRLGGRGLGLRLTHRDASLLASVLAAVSTAVAAWVSGDFAASARPSRMASISQQTTPMVMAMSATLKVG
jgi:hypothetical protein